METKSTKQNGKHWIENSETGRNISFALLTLIGLLCIFLIAKTVNEVRTYPTIGDLSSDHNTINVTGKGEVSAAPTIGTFSFTIDQTSPTVTAAETVIASKGKKAVDFLKKMGVADKDIKTDSFNTNPHYESRQVICNTNICPPSNQVINGYDVSQTVTVTVRKIGDSAQLIAGIGALGINTISSFSASIDDVDNLQIQARDLAIKNAHENARNLAQALGVKLGKVVGFQESGGGYPVPMYDSVSTSMSKGVSSVPTLPTGENKVTSNVTIVYEIH